MVRFANCIVYTINNKSQIAESFVVDGNKFAGVGTLSEMRSAFPEAKEYDLKGAAVLPGLIDGHAHPLMATQQLSKSETTYPSKFDELMKWIKSEASSGYTGKWSYIHRIFPSRLDAFRYPTLRELDEVSPNVPVFLNGAFGGMLNSIALKLSGITKDSNHPGVIKNSKGELTGALLRSAHHLVAYKMDGGGIFDEQEYVSMLNRYAALGITGVTEVSLNFATINKIKSMAERALLPLRISCNYCPGIPKNGIETEKLIANAEMKTGDGDCWFRMGPLKTYIDGGMLTATAFLEEPYGEPASLMFGGGKAEYRGVSDYYDPVALASVVDKAREKGWNYTAHCTGDGAVSTLLDAYKILHEVKPLNKERFQVLHGNFMSPRSLDLCSEMGIVWDMQAAWLYRDADALDFWLKKKRMNNFLPLKTAIKKGIVICGGSDHMDGTNPNSSVNPYNPWLGIYALCTRKSDKGTVFGVEQALTREEAIRAYTINNAYKSGEESVKGSIEKGKLADFIALEKDPFTCHENELMDLRPFLRCLDGKIDKKK